MAIPETRNLSYQGANLPQVTEADDGKVLGVVGGKWAIKKDEADPELPVPTIADAGKIPSVNAQGKYALITPEKELPAVSSTDNGKVMRVANGAWEKSANDSVFYVNIYNDGGTYAADKTFQQMLAALYNGQFLVAVTPNPIVSGGYVHMPLIYADVSDDETVGLSFGIVAAESTSTPLDILTGLVVIREAGTVTVSVGVGTLTPIE